MMKVCHGHLRSELGKDLLPSSLIHLWVGFSPSQVVVLKCLLPCWLLATISPYYFLTCPCTSSLLISYWPNLPWISQFVPCCHIFYVHCILILCFSMGYFLYSVLLPFPSAKSQLSFEIHLSHLFFYEVFPEFLFKKVLFLLTCSIIDHIGRTAYIYVCVPRLFGH